MHVQKRFRFDLKLCRVCLCGCNALLTHIYPIILFQWALLFLYKEHTVYLDSMFSVVMSVLTGCFVCVCRQSLQRLQFQDIPPPIIERAANPLTPFWGKRMNVSVKTKDYASFLNRYKLMYLTHTHTNTHTHTIAAVPVPGEFLSFTVALHHFHCVCVCLLEARPSIVLWRRFFLHDLKRVFVSSELSHRLCVPDIMQCVHRGPWWERNTCTCSAYCNSSCFISHPHTLE